MRYPGFVAEMGRESNRPKLWAGVWSGYAIAAGFDWRVVRDGPREFSGWHWAPSGRLRLQLRRRVRTASALNAR